MSKFFSAILLTVVTSFAHASITITTPSNGAQVYTSFPVAASADNCGGQAVSAMGFSIDNSTNTTITPDPFFATAQSTTGTHILHVKCWGNQGAAGHVDLTINVGTAPTGIPSNAIVVNNVQALTNWKWEHDSGTSGSSVGTSVLTSAGIRENGVYYSNYGGERWSSVVGYDAYATHFVYDTYLYIVNSANDISNIELDMNQVMYTGNTIIYAFQCSAWSNTWDYTANVGTPTSPQVRWLHSNQYCNPKKWAVNTWHHVQIAYHRDNNGNVTYEYVILDGQQQNIGVTVNSAFALHWGAAVLVTNFQLDGATSTSGSAMVYQNHLTVYRW